MPQKNNDILALLAIKPSARSRDYLTDKKQFQLHTLLTEQRHPKTWNLSSTIQENTARGLKQIFSVDEDIAHKFGEMVRSDTILLDRAARAIAEAIRTNKKIYIYGCGSTGRLAKQMESAIWRPFWKRIKTGDLWKTLKNHLPQDIEDRLIGEMTGGDRALISALEGFEDLELVGRLQFEERGINKGDAVFCITEGGETSSVIGTIKSALQLYRPLFETGMAEARKSLFFLYNNPDAALKVLDRSRFVIENPGINRINLTTGPQTVAGSTRMQAATSETFVLGTILEAGIHTLLKDFLSPSKLSHLGFGHEFNFQDRLTAFSSLHKLITDSVQHIARWTNLEEKAYRNGKRATYFAAKALFPVFIDCAERSPTFHLHPLDTVRETNKKSWLQVWTGASCAREAWKTFLGRNFRGLEERFYKSRFENEIEDPYLKRSALDSLALAGFGQEGLYDFSFSGRNITDKGPEPGDVGVLTCIDEESEALADPKSPSARFLRLLKRSGADVAVVAVGEKNPLEDEVFLKNSQLEKERDTVLHFPLSKENDPLNLKRQILLKILFNGHSTGVMAKLGKVVGNTMTNVKPSNLKLIGRATSLIVSHVNDTTGQSKWKKAAGQTPPLSYAEANAVLFEAMDFVSRIDSQRSEVELAIIRILEALRAGKNISWEKTMFIAQQEGLENYLKKHNPALCP